MTLSNKQKSELKKYKEMFELGDLHPSKAEELGFFDAPMKAEKIGKMIDLYIKGDLHPFGIKTLKKQLAKKGLCLDDIETMQNSFRKPGLP